MVRAEIIDQVRDHLALVGVPIKRGYEGSITDGVLEETPKVALVPVDATERFLKRLNSGG